MVGYAPQQAKWKSQTCCKAGTGRKATGSTDNRATLGKVVRFFYAVYEHEEPVLLV